MKNEWLDLVKYKPVAYGIESGFHELGDIHNEWIKKIILSDEDFTLQAHRGSFKTTCISIAVAIMMIVYPNKTILFMRKTDEDVKEVIYQVGRLLESPIYRKLSESLHGKELVKTKESAYDIDTNVKVGIKGTPQLLGIGSKASITGKHADIIITDDIVNIDDRISRAHRDRTKLTYQELQNIKNKGGRIINAGTPWHKNDCFGLMPNIETYDCYSTGMMTGEEIQNKRDTMTPSLFAANYELKHISSEEQIFPAPVIDDGSNTDKIFNGICHIDAAYGGSDYCAFTILKEHEGKIYVFGMLDQKHIDDVVDRYEDYRAVYKAGTLYNETNADKGYLAKKIKKPVKTYHEKMNKHIKISLYLKERWKDIIFISDTSREYINQILDYTENAEHDDAPDSLASLLRVINKKTGISFLK